MKRKKLFLLLALLMTAVTGAWADETPLVTIESKNYESFTSGSQTFDDKVTVTFSRSVYNYGDDWGWTAGTSSLLTVAGINGYTITSCKFYTETGAATTGYTVEGESPSVYLQGGYVYTDASKSVNLGQYGVKKIEVYGTAPAASGYTVSLKDGVKDAAKWTITPNEGVKEGDQVTLQYNGRLKVKGVKATSDAAAPAVPDGAIGGVFSVSDGKQVYFSKGNLRYASSKWSFFDNQYDYYTSHSADAWDHFGWSTSAPTYGMNTSTTSSDYSGDFVDWGATMGTGWRTLTSDEWTYLLNTRSASTVNGTADGRYAKAMVNGVQGVILFPDSYTHPDGVAAPTGVNATGNTGWTGNNYDATAWGKMEAAGCVFLPAAGYRNGSMVNNAGSYGYYWSATSYGTGNVYCVYISSGTLVPANLGSRRTGLSVRLVQEATSGAAPAAGQKALAEATAEDIGKVVGADGNIYDTKAAAEAANTTAAAMIAYVGSASDCTHGLAIALADESGDKSWSDAGIVCSGKTAVTGGTWRLPSNKDWQYMFIGCGSNESYSEPSEGMKKNWSGLSSKLEAAGGTVIPELLHWSSTTNSSGEYGWSLGFGNNGDAVFYDEYEDDPTYVRACLAF